MTVYIIFSSIGTDAGPFNLYSDVDGFSSAFSVGNSRTQLLAGFASFSVPNGTTIIRAKSFGVCTNYVDLNLLPAPTSTTTTSSSTTTTTSTTIAPTTTTTTTALPTFREWHFSSPGRGSSGLACSDNSFTNIWYTSYQVGNIPALGSTLYSNSLLTGPPVNGGDFWYNLSEALIDEPTVYQIGIGGTLDDFFVCP